MRPGKSARAAKRKESEVSGNIVSQGPKIWRPDEGDPNPLAGKVTDMRHVTGQYKPYPLVTIEDADGQVWEFHASRKVARSELAELGPEVGDRVTISFAPPAEGKDYFRYKVTSENAKPRPFDWSKYDNSGLAPAVDGERPSVVDTPPDDDFAPPKRADHGNDDVPF